MDRSNIYIGSKHHMAQLCRLNQVLEEINILVSEGEDITPEMMATLETLNFIKHGSSMQDLPEFLKANKAQEAE